MVELAYTLPLILLILIGTIEVVFFGRTYSAILEATVVSSRLGSAGTAFYDNNKILELTTQVLSREGYNSAQLIDVIITRAELVNGTQVVNYKVVNMLGSGRSPCITQTTLKNRLRSGDPTLGIIGVEIIFEHKLLFGLAHFLPNPLTISAFTINALPK